jgi:hypothetical protein
MGFFQANRYRNAVAVTTKLFDALFNFAQFYPEDGGSDFLRNLAHIV